MSLSPRALVSRLALWSLSASFPSVRLSPRGRFARARLVVCGSPFGPVRLLGPVVVAPTAGVDCPRRPC